MDRGIYRWWFFGVLVTSVIDNVHGNSAPSEWIKAKLESINHPISSAIDIASGAGRHSLLLADKAPSVTAVDRNPELFEYFENTPVRFQCLDLEKEDWPMNGDTFDVVLVSNYLYRPHLSSLIGLVGPNGYLIYETFGIGNERFGKPSNPHFLLRPEELEGSVGNGFMILDEFFGEVTTPQPAVRARLFAQRVES